MQIKVEMHSGYGDFEVPRRFWLDGREVKVSDNLSGMAPITAISN